MRGTAKQILVATATLAGLWSNGAAGQPVDDPPRLSVGTDHWLTVERDGITRTVRLVEHQSLATEPRGAVMLFTGDFGQYDYYERGGPGHQAVVDTLLARDIDIWSISYPYGDGWGEGAQGLGYRIALRIVEDVCAYVADNARAPNLGAQGNSGGGLQILYALQAGSCALEIAIVSGTPVVQHRAPYSETRRLCWGGDRTDHLLGFAPGDCAANSLSASDWSSLDADALLGQSLENLGRVVIINSDLNVQDRASGWWAFRGLSLPGKALIHVPGEEHEVDETVEGSLAIIDFLDQCVDGC
jgi:hypothetical protein